MFVPFHRPTAASYSITTSTGGTATQAVPLGDFVGYFYGFTYDGGLDNNASVTIRYATSGATIWTSGTLANTPVLHIVEIDSSGPAPLVQEDLEIVISAGGNTQTGVFELYLISTASATGQ